MKKGDLNLSIQVIVIVVIAFVVLGLGLQFVRTQFGRIGEDFGNVQDQIRQQIQDDLRTGNKKLSFPATTINMERGKSKDIAIGVKNVGQEGDLLYSVKIDPIRNQEDSTKTPLQIKEEIEFFYEEGQSTLSATDVRVHPIRILAKTNSQGTYLFKLVINLPVTVGDPTPQPYDEKTFFVTVN